MKLVMLPTSEPTNMKPAMRCAILKLQPTYMGVSERGDPNIVP